MARKRPTASLSSTRSVDRPMLEARQTLSGLDFFRKLLTGEVPRGPMLTLLGIELLEVDKGRVVFGVTPSEGHYNGLGVAHGGLAATLLDSALGCAINSAAAAGQIYTTAELKVNLTRPLRAEVGPVRCEARVIHMGSRIATSEGRIVDAEGRIYAHGTTTCVLYEASRGQRSKVKGQSR